MKTPTDHINDALAVEQTVPKEEIALYMDCMNGVPMSMRQTEQEIRDGCIMTHHVYLTISALHPRQSPT